MITTFSIENVYYIVGIIVAIPTIVSAIINVITYIFNKKSLKIQKAIEMTHYYKEKILFYAYPINDVFESSGINKLFNSVKISEKSKFDCREIEKNKIRKSEIDEIFSSDAFSKSIFVANIMYDLKLPVEILENEDKKNKAVDMHKANKYFMENIVYDTLNNMEYFSMNFRHGIANEKVAYNSLHQTFVPLVESLYYQISNNNKINQKYFTNVIWLYKKWKEREKSNEKKLDEAECKSYDEKI